MKLNFLYENKDGEKMLSIGRMMVILVFVTIWVMYWMILRKDPPETMMEFMWSGMIYIGFSKVVQVGQNAVSLLKGGNASNATGS